MAPSYPYYSTAEDDSHLIEHVYFYYKKRESANQELAIITTDRVVGITKTNMDSEPSTCRLNYRGKMVRNSRVELPHLVHSRTVFIAPHFAYDSVEF